MTLASLLLFVLARKLGLRGRLLAQAEVAAPLARGRSPARLRGDRAAALLFETIRRADPRAALVDGLRLLARPLRSGLGIFHAITAFNNAGFALWSDSLTPFATDGWICVTIALRSSRAASASRSGSSCDGSGAARTAGPAHEADAVLTFALLVIGGTGAVLAFEWTNPGTLGQLARAASSSPAFFQGVTPRTAGFNTVDYGAHGAGDALRHRLPHVRRGRERLHRRRDQGDDARAACADGLGGAARRPARDRVLAAAARRTPSGRRSRSPRSRSRCCLRQARSRSWPTASSRSRRRCSRPSRRSARSGSRPGSRRTWRQLGQWILIALMYLGRVGPHTLGVALVLRERQRLYRFPEERPIIG